MRSIRPSYHGLETVFDTHLASHVAADATFRRHLREYLAKNWFSDGRDSYFPGQKVAQKYAEGVIKTLELALNGKPHPVPINAWWIIQPEADVRMLTLADVDHSGVTVSSSVTLLICTPMPPITGAPSTRCLWGDAEAWVTEHDGDAVVVRQIEKEVRRGG
ncbi:MAG TPA: hypothetical protein VKX28_31045 [Xanthobacteraceae bacterium]|nr:hypothetical protein [Xanthobacteraceae bacterium]